MKKNVFRILALMLALALIVGTFAACGDKEDDPSTTDEITEEETEETTDEEETEDETGEATTDNEVTTDEDPGNGGTEQSKKPETNQEILDAYTVVLNKAKAAAPAYTKKEFQTIPSTSPDREVRKGQAAISIIMGIAESSFTTEDKAKEDVRPKGEDMEWFPIAKNDKGNYMTDVNFIKSASSEIDSNGNIKLVIVLKDELNSQPTPENSNAPVSKIGSMFYPLPMSDITDALEDPTVSALVKVEKFDINYHDCTATIVYNPANNELISLEHQIVGGLDAKGRATLISFDFFQNIYSTLRLTDFTY